MGAMVTNLFEVRSCGLQLFGKSLPRRHWFRQLWFICATRFGMMHGSWRDGETRSQAFYVLEIAGT